VKVIQVFDIIRGLALIFCKLSYINLFQPLEIEGKSERSVQSFAPSGGILTALIESGGVGEGVRHGILQY